MEPRFEEFVWLPCIKLKITAKLLELLSHRNPCSDEAPRAVFELLLMRFELIESAERWCLQTSLCNFVWSTTSCLSCNNTVITLTVDCGISRKEELLKTVLLQWWHQIQHHAVNQ